MVMEDSEDALLPEPLPGEGVAYEGEIITGVVDGRTFDAHEPSTSSRRVGERPAPTTPSSQFETLASFEEARR